MRELVVLLDQLQRLGDRDVVLEPVLPHLERHLDHVLHSLLQFSLVQNILQHLKYSVHALRADFLQFHAALLEERDGHFDRVVGRRLDEQREDLQREDLVSDALIDQVRNKSSCRQANAFIVATKAPLELDDEPVQQELPDAGELRVDDGHQRRIDVRESRRRVLRLNDGATEQTATANDVLLEQVARDDADVVDVHFVDEAVDGLLQCLPGNPLVRRRVLIGDFCLEQSKLCRRNVGATSSGGQNVHGLLLLPRDNLWIGVFLRFGAAPRATATVGSRRRPRAGSRSRLRTAATTSVSVIVAAPAAAT